MSDIRIVGLVAGLLIALAAVVGRRRDGLSRGAFFGWVAFGAGVMALSLLPVLADPFRTLLRLENRLFSVLVIAALVLFFLQLRSRAAIGRLEERFGELVRSLAARDLISKAQGGRDGGTLAVVIAAFNEERALEGVLGELPEEVEGLPVRPIVVVDGGDDETESVARRATYDVAVHPINRGQGDALRTGFRVALRGGAAVVVTMDADGQHDPAELNALVKPIVAGEADYVQGSRFLGRYDDAGSARDAGIRFFTRVINLLAGTEITDCTNGFRAIRAEALAELRLEEDRFSAPEIIMEAARNGLRMDEVPVHIRTRSHGDSKKPRRLGYPVGFLLVIIKVWLR